MPRATRSHNYEGVSSDTSVTSTASSRLAKATQQKNHKLPVGAIAEATPLEVVNEVPVVPKKVPPHPPVHHICPPDSANSIKAPAPDVAAMLPAEEFPPTINPASNLVEPVTGSKNNITPDDDVDSTMTPSDTKTPATDVLPTTTASDSVPNMTPSDTKTPATDVLPTTAASDLVPNMTLSDTKTPATDVLPTMTASDLVPNMTPSDTKTPATDVLPTTTASDLVPVMTAAPDFVESVTGLTSTKATPSISVELVTGSEFSKWCWVLHHVLIQMLSSLPFLKKKLIIIRNSILQRHPIQQT